MSGDDVSGLRLTDAVSMGLLTSVFPPVVVDAAVDRAGVKEKLHRQLPARLMVYFLVACWVWSGQGYVRVLREVVAGLAWAFGGYQGWKVPYDGSITKARVRLGDAVMADLFSGCRGPVGGQDDVGVFYQGLRVCAIDGTVYDLERTVENCGVFATPTGGVFPQVRMVVLAECGTLAVVDAVFDSISVGERELAQRLLPSLSKDMLVLADRGFPSYDLYQKTVATGAQVGWRVSASFVLPVIESLADGSWLSYLHGSGRQKHDRVRVRVIEFTVHDQDTGTSERYRLVTSLLDSDRYQAADIAGLYLERWKAELLFKILKVQVRTTHATLRSKSPAMVRQELWALLCCYQAIRQVVSHAAHLAGLDPGLISFPPVLDAVRRSVATAFSPH